MPARCRSGSAAAAACRSARARPAACRGSAACGRISKYSSTRSCSTDGANGRNDSRNLIFRFITDCISRAAGVAQDAAAAQGPRAELHAALQPADDLLRGDQLGDAVAQLVFVVRAGGTWRPGRRGTRGSRRSEKRGPEQRAALLRPAGRRCAGCPSSWCQMNRAAPSAPPASPAAGWIQMSSNGPFAQDAAVGHAVQRHAAGQAQVASGRSARGRAGPCGA